MSNVTAILAEIFANYTTPTLPMMETEALPGVTTAIPVEPFVTPNAHQPQ